MGHFLQYNQKLETISGAAKYGSMKSCVNISVHMEQVSLSDCMTKEMQREL